MMQCKALRAALCLLLPALLAADEGIWLLNRFPAERVREKYGLEISSEFLELVRSASVRLNNGGSGSFVSARGLIFTNHHVASDCIQKLSTAGRNLMRDGFWAAKESEERACPDMEVNVLQEIRDVTGRVNADVADDTPPAEANRLRKAAMTRIETECTNSTGDRCDVVTLYSGGNYHLYRYKKYTDIRLVFAPEVGIAAFGGDPDNFTYPRYCLDIAFLRAYEKGAPASTARFLRWSATGARDGELTFVSGHPGTTGRLATVAELEFARDVSYPFILRKLSSLIDALQVYGASSPEHRRIAQDNLFSQQNSFKAYTGFLAGLRDPGLMNQKREEEKALRAGAEADLERKRKFGNTWDEVAAAYQEYALFYRPSWLLERTPARGSELFAIARMVLRYAAEKAKPNEERLREYVDPALPSLEQSMYSEAPIHDSMEIAVLTEYLKALREELGDNHALIRELLGGKTPAEAARVAVSTTKLKDVAERKRLANDADASTSSEDGMLRLVRVLDPEARNLRKRYEDRIEAIISSSASRIAQLRFSLSGTADYPDATFTLRLSYGPVRGYRNARNEPTQWATEFAGLYRRATGRDPYALPDRWVRSKGLLNLRTPFNFVTTCDTHGGNSGSPTINASGEVIGIVFDGNLESLPNRFVYRDQRERTVHVASQGIVEALKKIYRAGRLLEELGVIDR